MRLSNSVIMATFFLLCIQSCIYQSTTVCHVESRKIRVDSLMLLENLTVKNEVPFEGNKWSSLKVSTLFTNICNDTLILKTSPLKNEARGELILLINNKNFGVYSWDHADEWLESRWDTLSPNNTHKYTVIYPYNDPLWESGPVLAMYVRVAMPFYYPVRDTVYFADSTFMITPFKYDDKLYVENRFVIKVNLTDNTVRLVDSTYEDIMESYNLRNFTRIY